MVFYFVLRSLDNIKTVETPTTAYYVVMNEGVYFKFSLLPLSPPTGRDEG
jgi:hypothetical protein